MNLIISRAHIADMPIIDAINKYYDLLLPVLTNNSSDNDEIKLLEKTIEWGENNIRQQKALIAIDRIDIISEKFEKDFLSNYLNEDMKAVLRAFKSVNCETCSMDELNEAWGFMTDFMENPGCNMIGAYKRTSTALDEFRKNAI